ncbi:MAG: hypothetical protein ACREON_08040, partial [Gemmatimonadaceae bacterium]
MPLLAAALIAYAAGLVIGFGGVLVLGSCGVAALLAVAGARRSSVLGACAAAAGAGLLVAYASATMERACRRRAAASHEWVAVLQDAAFPGAYVRARAGTGSCEVHASVLVERGAAPAGSVVLVVGTAVESSRGIRIQRATVRRTQRRSPLLAMRALAGAAIDSAF